MSELDETVKKLKELNWEEIYEKENTSLAMISPPFEEMIKVCQYRYEWVIKQIKQKYNNNDINILNIGSSSGVLEYFLLKEGYNNITSLDVDDATLKRMSDRVKGVKWIKGVVESMSFDESEFDVVIATEVIEHLLKPKIAIESMIRVLVPNGLLLVTTPIEKKVFSNKHLHFFDLYKIVYLFKEYGNNFKVIEIHKWNKKKVQKEPNIFAVRFIKND